MPQPYNVPNVAGTYNVLANTVSNLGQDVSSGVKLYNESKKSQNHIKNVKSAAYEMLDGFGKQKAGLSDFEIAMEKQRIASINDSDQLDKIVYNQYVELQKRAQVNEAQEKQKKNISRAAGRISAIEHGTPEKTGVGPWSTPNTPQMGPLKEQIPYAYTPAVAGRSVPIEERADIGMEEGIIEPKTAYEIRLKAQEGAENRQSRERIAKMKGELDKEKMKLNAQHQKAMEAISRGRLSASEKNNYDSLVARYTEMIGRYNDQIVDEKANADLFGRTPDTGGYETSIAEATEKKRQLEDALKIMRTPSGIAQEKREGKVTIEQPTIKTTKKDKYLNLIDSL